jgi:hypothetical protein
MVIVGWNSFKASKFQGFKKQDQSEAADIVDRLIKGRSGINHTLAS